MGNNSNRKSQEIPSSDDQLQFYIDVEDPNLGPAKIYTSRKMPLCFILKHEKTLHDSKIFNIFTKVEHSQSNALLSMYGFRIDRNTCCNAVGPDRVITYWQYYNFYFSDYVKKRSQHGCMFLDVELWHMVEVCCEGYGIFRKYGTYFDIDPRSMVITPEGKLKLCWGHLKSQNSHMKFMKYFEEGRAEKFFYSPEELQCMYLGQRTTKLDFDKANTFRLGMIVLQCLSLHDPLALCYNPSLTKINFAIIKNLINTKVVPSYEPDFVNFLRSLLKENPKQRPTLMEVSEKYDKYMCPQYELRVCGKGPKGEEGHQNFREEMLKKKRGEMSDAKTVKLNQSNRN